MEWPLQRLVVGWLLPRIVLLGALALALHLAPEPPQASAAPDRPNVLLVVADDMRYDGLIAMPELQALAERGTTFSRSFVTTPLCCPSRASILTGLYAHHHGVLSNHSPSGGVEAFDDRSTLATWLQPEGVRTGLVGRYLNEYASHYVPPGWDEWFAQWESSEEYGIYHRYRVTDQGEQRYFGSAARDYSTSVFGQQALRFLAGEKDRPFFLMLGVRAPHGPAAPDPLDSGKFKELDLPVPPSYNESDVSDKPSRVRGRQLMKEDEREDLELFRRRQLESLVSVDRVISLLVEALRADGRLDKTWIIFTSDNGLTLGEHRLARHKGCPYEECVRVPLLIIPPSGRAARPRDNHLVANIDLAPTISAIMGVEPPTRVDGQSLLGLLDNESTPWRDGLALEMFNEDEEGPRFLALRTVDRKYVTYPGGEEELYDVSADPFELENRATHPDRSTEKARLSEQLKALLAARSP